MRRTEAVYTVQMRYDDATFQERQGLSLWEDIATVTVPTQTKRKTVIEKVVADMAMTIEGTAHLRVIPAEHAEPIKVEMEQPPPRLRIG